MKNVKLKIEIFVEDEKGNDVKINNTFICHLSPQKRHTSFNLEDDGLIWNEHLGDEIRQTHILTETQTNQVSMKKSENNVPQGTTVSTNWMLDETKSSFEANGLKSKGLHSKLINQVTVQKIEYGRMAIKQVLNSGKTIEQIRDYAERLDVTLQGIIESMGGEAKQYAEFKPDEKAYRQIDSYLGHIDGAVRVLHDHRDKGELVCINFNGHKLFSDVDDIDSAYLKVTGKNKSDFDEEERNRNEEYREEERKHKEAIPELTKDWVAKGKEVLDEQYWELWEKCVPVRLDDLYRGMELGMCLDIVKELNEGCDFEKAKTVLEGQGHSGMSFGLICSMITSFCERGAEFVKYAK